MPIDATLALEYERTRAIIKASENWSDQYRKQPEIFAKLVKSEARLERKLISFFKQMADENHKLVNWISYSSQVRAADVSVIVIDDGFKEFNGLFVTTTFDDIALSAGLGALAGQDTYKLPLGLDSGSAAIQEVVRARIATLVGMKLDKTGILTPNPNAAYTITDDIRSRIQSSILTSLSLGEPVDQARDRVASVIKNPDRALLIAQTETVNAYQSGLTVFGKESGAVGKEVDDVDADDECADYANLGPVPFDYLYGDEFDAPTFHPRCRCSRRLIYQNELDNNPDLFD